jgi:hypothetical protein
MCELVNVRIVRTFAKLVNSHINFLLCYRYEK